LLVKKEAEAVQVLIDISHPVVAHQDEAVGPSLNQLLPPQHRYVLIKLLAQLLIFMGIKSVMRKDRESLL
jgi:hypothetical protein